jgi:hypothetical protein
MLPFPPLLLLAVDAVRRATALLFLLNLVLCAAFVCSLLSAPCSRLVLVVGSKLYWGCLRDYHASRLKDGNGGEGDLVGFVLDLFWSDDSDLEFDK